MEIIIDVVEQSKVTQEVLDAMAGSIDRFSQDRSFDFKLVRVDQFLVPPTYLERFDDACMVYYSENHTHPDRDSMEPILLHERKGYKDESYLGYAAVLYRTGDFGPNTKWGGCFYLRHDTLLGEKQFFTRVDCQEKINDRNEGLITAWDISRGLMGISEKDIFTLPWIFAFSDKGINISDERPPHRSVDDLVKHLKEADMLATKVNSLIPTGQDLRRCMRFALAYNLLKYDQPNLYNKGAGQHLEKLFTELGSSTQS